MKCPLIYKITWIEPYPTQKPSTKVHSRHTLLYIDTRSNSDTQRMIYVKLIHIVLHFTSVLYFADYQRVINTYHSALRNGPFRELKWTVLQAEMICFRMV